MVQVIIEPEMGAEMVFQPVVRFIKDFVMGAYGVKRPNSDLWKYCIMFSLF
jgi:hypothetical protein